MPPEPTGAVRAGPGGACVSCVSSARLGPAKAVTLKMTPPPTVTNLIAVRAVRDCAHCAGGSFI